MVCSDFGLIDYVRIYTYHQELMKSLGSHGCSSLLLIRDEDDDGLTFCEQLL
jgi:hypothetical protein